MFLRRWEDLPAEMQNDKVRPYYDILQKKKSELFLKFIFDRVVSLIMLIILIPVFVILAILIKLDSPGEVFFRQERITQYGKFFSIYKFRTMVKDAEKIGTQVTTNSDSRITSIACMSCPHAFKYGFVYNLYKEAIEQGIIDSVEPHTTTLMYKMRKTIYFSKGSQTNIKITNLEDINLFEGYLLMKESHKQKKNKYRD